MVDSIEQHPYMFCYKCNKLAPIRDWGGQEAEAAICKICLSEIVMTRNRIVYLSKNEAETRGLISFLRGW